MFRRTNYSGYLLADRDTVLAALAAAGFAPAHPNVVAEHVTHTYPSPDPAPPAGTVTVVGYAADDRADTLIVAVDGDVYRPDGRLFHLTYSLADGVRPVYAGELASVAYANGTWVRLDSPVPVTAVAF